MAAAPLTLEQLVDSLTVEGELYESQANGALTCYACGHRCLIKPGKRGICKVRFNEAGKLKVPWGYVGALQCDPTEKKPFFHIYPGSDTLTFGMLGCDLHCPYCFTPDTPIVTERGVFPIAELFEQGGCVPQPDGAEVAFPKDLRVITSSGRLRRVIQVFKHPYRGALTVIKPYYLPELRCTPNHGVYATIDPARQPERVEAQKLEPSHFLFVSQQLATSGTAPETMRRILQDCAVNDDFYLVPVQSIRAELYAGDVYNLEVEAEHNYLANFVLVANCQNWVTSQALRDPASELAGASPQLVTPQQLITLAQQQGAALVGSSYNEPLITSEWAVSVFKEAARAGLKCVYISNGNATPEVLDYLRPHIVGYKIDLKTMSDKTYRRLGAVLENVLNGVRMVHARGLWLEIVTLIIPGFNDSEAELRDAAQFLAALSPDIPWHVTAFHQDYKMMEPDNASARHLLRAAEIGREAGLRYVYAGNLPGRVGEHEHTFCPTCHAKLIERSGYVILDYALTARGACPRCGTVIPGIWTDQPDTVRLGGSGRPRAMAHAINRYRSDLPDP